MPSTGMVRSPMGNAEMGGSQREIAEGKGVVDQSVLNCELSTGRFEYSLVTRYGVMTLLDDRGWGHDFLSSGMTADEAEQM